MVGASAYLGLNSIFGVAEEATWGTYVTATAYVEFTSESMKKSIERVNVESISLHRDYHHTFQTGIAVEGSVEANFQPTSDAICLLMKHAFGGGVTSTTIGAGCVKHEFNFGNLNSNTSSVTAAVKPALSIGVKKGNQYFNYVGCRVNNMSLKAEIDAPVTVAFDLIGKDSTFSSDSLTASFSGTPPVNFIGVKFSAGETTTTLSEEQILSLELNIGNNLINDASLRALGSRYICDLPLGRRECTLKIKQRFDTTTAYTRWFNGGRTCISINLDTLVTMGSIAGNTTASMLITIDNAYMNYTMPEVGDLGALTHEMEFICIMPDPTTTASGGNVLRATVFNGTAGY